ncbi:MAG: ABC transporter permease [Puniceicoccaceae bacterium]
MEHIISDIRFGIRQLIKHPFFTLIAVVALGLGIGSVSTQLSVVNGLFFKGLPFEEPRNIVHLERINVERENYGAEVPILEFLEWTKQQEAFEGLAGYYIGTANFTLGNTVERYNGAFLSANSFDLLRVKAAMGRGLQPADDLPDAPDIVVLSHKIWSRDFGSDPEIIGKTAVLNGRSVQIVGVMPEDFAFPVSEDLWVPLMQQQDITTLSWGEPAMSLEVFGRLKDGINMDQARSSMAVMATNIEAAYPETQQGYRDVDVKPFLDEFFDQQAKTMTSIMLLITGLILVIACANVANLLLARSMRRRKEVAIRSALGASRQRIISQFLTESILIAVLGAILALILTQLDIKRIKGMMVEMNSPFWMDFSLDWRVLVIVSVVTILTGIFSGIVPAYRASRLKESEILKDDTRTSSSLHMGIFSKILVVVQISVAAIILTLVVLFVKSVNNAIAVDYAYDADGILTTRLGLFEEAYPDEESRANFVNPLLQRLRARPEIAMATTSHRYQFLNAPGTRYAMPGETYDIPSDREFARFQYVSETFFQAVGLPILQGRDFNPEDYSVDYPRFALVNEAFAEREWPGESPIGKRFAPDLMVEEYEEGEKPLIEVVGVVPSMQESGVFQDSNDDGAAFFLPQTASTMPRFITIIVRGREDISELAPVLREEVGALDKNLPLYAIGTPRELNEQATIQFRFFASIFRSFGILAAFLCAVGIYGVISFSVNQRIMEFGIRQALGATRSAIFKLVFGHAFKQLGFGFLIALLCLSPIILSPGVKDSMALFFYEIDHDSLFPYLISFGFVTFISLLAAAPPASRAARIHPAQALRYE